MQFRICFTVMLAVVPAGLSAVFAEDLVSFNRDIRPILAGKCLACHGPDDHARQAELRLDTFDGATAMHDGTRAITVGRPDASELIRRVNSTNPTEIMPPPEANKTLTPRQKELLRRWIESGAKYEHHWAFSPPTRPEMPSLEGLAVPAEWVANPIDRFLLARMTVEKLVPSPPADRLTLIRRVSLDLIGLPPTIEEADAFVADPDPLAYEKLVNRLMASERYGERWARRWLDLARYADTNGYEKDRERPIWPWRDWVIRAINSDLPFDRFTIEQLAGDMLPEPGRDQLVATGFHRNTMLNEEGGIDPLEFRFYAMTDRVSTTATTWLGLTMGCVQCHAHKYDPIQHAEYYGMMALLNNANEPDLELIAPEAIEQQRLNAARVPTLIAELPDHWPIDDVHWETPSPIRVVTISGQIPAVQPDQSCLFPADSPESDVYTIILETPPGPQIDRLRLEALPDPSLPSRGPGRVVHGNFVLNEIRVRVEPLTSAGVDAVDVKIVSAKANAEQPQYSVAAAFDRDEKTGWAVQVPGEDLHTTKEATFQFEKPLDFPGGARWTIELKQTFGAKHTIGRPRLSLGRLIDDDHSQTERRRDAAETAFAKWLDHARLTAVEWRDLVPASMKTNLPLLTLQHDHSIFASGDISKDDVYELTFDAPPPGITALRLEAIPDDRLPARGPGMAYYEGPKGDFYLAEFEIVSGGTRQAVKSATANVGVPMQAVDGHMQTGWACENRFGESHQAVFVLADPLVESRRLTIMLRMGRHYAASLGRFRLSVSTDPKGGAATTVPQDRESLLLISDADLTPDQRNRLREAFFLTTPELAQRARKIRDLLKPTTGQSTLVLQERPIDNPRTTRRHHRGEYLQPREEIAPGVPAALLLPGGTSPKNRLEFARWLVSPENPLTARVVVNREWAAFFGQGLVRTPGDFGVMGDAPSHPDLLDWLATEFGRDGWSRKRLHRLIVTSAAYRQSSRVAPESGRIDSRNIWLSRFPRTRVDAELIRDITLSAAGLLSVKMYGTPVKPPQPASVTEAAYGGRDWTVSTGPDRYRRGVYTFLKRTAPYAMFNTFDGPTGEFCVAQREVSNTPLQSLTLLNDAAFVEAAQQLGRIAGDSAGGDDAKVALLFRRCLTRPPMAAESERLLAFVIARRKHLATFDEATLIKIAGPANYSKSPTLDRAVWTALSRALLNLDETITRN